MSQISKAVAELQMLAKNLEADDAQYLLGIANTLTRHSTALEGRIKEQHEAICQLLNQMLGALEEINKAYYTHAIELIDISASLSAKAQLVGNSSLTPKAMDVAPVLHGQGPRPSGPVCRLWVEDDEISKVATNGAGAEHRQEIGM